MLGDLGLFGLKGMDAFSLPGLPRMASERVEDFGIFLNFLGGEFHGCSTSLFRRSASKEG
jgi:hypothetical protein